MDRNIRNLFLTPALCMLLTLASPAFAQDFGGMSFWGDSSTDNGNVMTLLLREIPGMVPADLPSITNGRLTNGPNWADYVTSAFGRGNEASLLGGADYAFGGALMGQGTAKVPEVPFDFYVPNLGSVIDGYLARGGRFAADEVVFLFAGHNDALKIATTGTMAVPDAVAKDLGNNLEKLYQSGARQFVVPTLVAVESAPEIIAYAGAKEIIGSWIAAYQAEAKKALAAFMAAHPDAVVITPDIGALTRRIIANPGKYGFTNVTETGFDETTNQARPDAGNYLWWDVHASTKAQRLFAQEVLGAMGDYYHPKQMLPQAAAAAMQINGILAREAMKRTYSSLRRINPSAKAQKQNRIYATPYYGWGNQSGGGMATGFDWKAYGTDVGFQRRFSSSFTAGLNLDIHEAEADCAAGGGDSLTKGMGVAAYAGYAKSNWRMQSGARYGRDGNNANRPLWLTGSTAKADFNTDSWAAWAELGRDFSPAKAITLMPLVNVNWVHVDGASADENGAGLMNSHLELNDQDNLRHLLGAALSASADMGEGKALLLQLTMGWRHEYLDNRAQGSAELAGTTRILDGPESGRDALALDLQISCPLPLGAALELAYSGDYFGNANAQSMLVRITAGF